MTATRPPLGLVPRFVCDAHRMAEIQAAVNRFMDVGRPVPIEWIAEYNELARRKEGEI
jgi:hypothetical protein